MSNARNQSDDLRHQIHNALYESLIDKIRNDTYPSATMMDTVEAGMNEEQIRDYARALLAKVRDDQFPSIDLMRRLSKLAG